MKRARRLLAVAMFAVGTAGLALATVGLIGEGEPYQTYLLSWAALAYAGFVAIEAST